MVVRLKYKTIVIDPPTKYGVWGKASFDHRPNDFDRPLPYKAMSIEEISNLPIKEFADTNCELYFWTTQKYLPNSFEIIKKWGFKYCQTLIWCKKPMGKGQGGVYCPTNEFLILARIGKMPKVERIDSTWFLVKRPHNSHSTKPEFFQDMIEKVSDEPRLEIFARRERLGWVTIGDELGKPIEITHEIQKVKNVV